MTVLEQRIYEAIIELAQSKRREPDYWAQLEHQAMIAYMQGWFASHREFGPPEVMAECAYEYAHALVLKAKETSK